jgi:hypothetical protein
MTSVTKWRIYCITEGEWSYGFKDTSDEAPTECFTDCTHTINENSVQELEVIGHTTQIVSVQEELVPTGGNFRCEGKKFTIGANSTASSTISWPYNITVLETFFSGSTAQIGNELDVIVAPETTVGILRESVSSGATVLPVSLTVVQNINVGYELFIGSVNLGEIISKDDVLLTVTLGTAIDAGYSANSLVKMQVINIKNLEIHSTSRYTIGRSKIGGRYLPANVPVKLIYTNNTNAEVTFNYEIEYLY